MAVSLARQVEVSLRAALGADERLRLAEGVWREHRVRFLRDAKAAGWTLRQMGHALGISEPAVRRFWRDHRMTATRLGGDHGQGAETAEQERDRTVAATAAHDGGGHLSVPSATVGRGPGR